MQGILYEEGSFGVFLLVTLLMGGGAAWMTGRSVAASWGSQRVLVVYMFALAAAVRFIHYALFGGTLLTAQFYAIDLVVLLVIGFLGFRRTRTLQMTDRYYWLFEATGPLTWKERASS